MAQEKTEKVDQGRPKSSIPFERIFATIAILSSIGAVVTYLVDPIRHENLKVIYSFYKGTVTIGVYYIVLTVFLCALGCLIVLYLYRCSKVLKKGRHMKTEFPEKHSLMWVNWVIFIPVLSQKIWNLLAILTGTPAYGTSCINVYKKTLLDWFDFFLGYQIHTVLNILLIISTINFILYGILKYNKNGHEEKIHKNSVAEKRYVYFHQALLLLSILSLHVTSAYDPVHRQMFFYGIFYCLEFGTRQVTSYSDAPFFIVAYILTFGTFGYASYTLITSFIKKYFR